VAGLVEYAAALSNACGHEVNIHRNARPDKTGRGTRRIERQRREPFGLNGLAALGVVLGCEFALSENAEGVKYCVAATA